MTLRPKVMHNYGHGRFEWQPAVSSLLELLKQSLDNDVACCVINRMNNGGTDAGSDPVCVGWQTSRWQSREFLGE